MISYDWSVCFCQMNELSQVNTRNPLLAVTGIITTGVHVRAAHHGCSTTSTRFLIAYCSADLKYLWRGCVVQTKTKSSCDNCCGTRLRRQRQSCEGGYCFTHWKFDRKFRGKRLCKQLFHSFESKGCLLIDIEVECLLIGIEVEVKKIFTKIFQTTVPVSMQLEIAPQHHLFMIGRSGANIKQIMQRTGASIHFPDPNTSTPQRKGTVIITGAIESVFLARQQVIVSTIHR